MESEPGAGRLHPATLLTAFLGVLRRAASSFFPLLVVGVLGGRGLKGGVFPLVVLGLSALGVVLSLGFALVRYFTFTYRITEGELRTAEGLWWKSERRIPLMRIQDIRLEQSLLYRLLGVAEVQVETAGGGGVEATLSVISMADAERLRAFLFARRGASFAGASRPDEELSARPAEPEWVLRTVSLRELIVAGMTQNWLGPAIVGLGGAFFWLTEYLPRRTQSRLLRAGAETASGWLSASGLGLGVGLAVVGLAVLLLGMLIVTVRTVLLFYGFRLTRDGEDLSRSYGLLTRRISRLPRRRIQVLEIEQSSLRRFLGVAVLRADTAGSTITRGQEGAHQTGRDVLVPLLPYEAVETLLPDLFPGLERSQPEWRGVSPLAIRRESMPGTWLLLLLSGGLVFLLRMPGSPLWWLGLLPLLLIPPLWFISRAGWKRLGWTLGGGLFRMRRGMVGRSEHLVPLRNLQVVRVRQSPFDRRLRLLGIHVDTAGQTLTGGGPRLSHLPEEEGWHLARRLAHEAQRQRFHWEH